MYSFAKETSSGSAEIQKRKEKKEKKYSIGNLKADHKHSIFHKKEIMESDLCGCFNCLATFK